MGACYSRARNSGDQKDVIAEWKANYSSSARSSLLHRHKYPVEEDFAILKDRLMGKGGCGEVYAAVRSDNKQLYAIKFCDKSKLDQTRLEREIMLLKDTDHPNIVRLFSVYVTPLMTYLVMELCAGGHLGKLLHSRSAHNLNKLKCIDEEWAKSLCRQLLSAVSHLHERGIAHRDIKLQNILLEKVGDRKAQVKLIDFGYASRFIGACPMRTVCGTPYTTAPEVFREAYDERCDVWSVGVVLFIMLSGKRPFEHLEIQGGLQNAGKTVMMTNILAGRYSLNPRYWSHVSEGAKVFVKALLHPKYLLRMSAKQAMCVPWIKTRTDLIPEKVHISVNALNCAQVDEEATTGGEGWGLAKLYTLRGKAPALSPAPSRQLSLTSQQIALSPEALEDMHRMSDSSKQLVNAMKSSDFEATMAHSLEILGTAGGQESERQTSAAVGSMIKNYKSDAGFGTLRRTGNMALAFGLHQSQSTHIRKLFQSVDIDGSGALCKAEFTQAMKVLCGDALSAKDCSMIFDQMDINRDDTISFTEFLAGTLNPETLDIEELSKAFALLDHNGDGFISVDEFKKLYNFKFMKTSYPTAEGQKAGVSCDAPTPGRADNARATAAPGVAAAPEIEAPEVPMEMTRISSNNNTEEDPPPAELPVDLSRGGTLDDTIMHIMRACDTDQDGQISYEEFIFAMTGAQELLEWAGPQAGEDESGAALVVEEEEVIERDGEAGGRPASAGHTREVEPFSLVLRANIDCTPTPTAKSRVQPVDDSHSQSNSISGIIKRGLLSMLSQSGSKVAPACVSVNPAQDHLALEKGHDLEYSALISSTSLIKQALDRKSGDDEEKSGDGNGISQIDG